MPKPMRSIIMVSLTLALASCGPSGPTSTGGAGGTNPCVAHPESCMGTCVGQCAPDAPGWPAVFFQLWSGPAGSTPPPCPEETPYPAHGYLDSPPDSVSCSECKCGSSQGVCGLPGTMTASDAACPATGSTSFDAPSVWDGTCTAQNAVSSADSLTISPPRLGLYSKCAASATKVLGVQGGGTIALACKSPDSVPDGKCPDGRVCAFPKVEGFRQCIVNFDGDAACPTDWPEKHLYYDEATLCSCTCGDPMGEGCSTTITVYQDGKCKVPLGSTTVSVDLPPACIDVAPGSALGSKSATPATYSAGTCAPTLTKSPPWTLCCLP